MMTLGIHNGKHPCVLMAIGSLPDGHVLHGKATNEEDFWRLLASLLGLPEATSNREHGKSMVLLSTSEPNHSALRRSGVKSVLAPSVARHFPIDRVLLRGLGCRGGGDDVRESDPVQHL